MPNPAGYDSKYRVALDRRICDLHLMSMQDALIELRQLALKHADGPRHETGIPRLSISQAEATTQATPGVYEPRICLILQGATCILIGDQALHYDEASY